MNKTTTADIAHTLRKKGLLHGMLKAEVDYDEAKLWTRIYEGAKIINGELGFFWVVTAEDADRLIAAGYEDA